MANAVRAFCFSGVPSHRGAAWREAGEPLRTVLSDKLPASIRQ
jgi:hypothetical protein